jgi:hypothetical protein
MPPINLFTSSSEKQSAPLRQARCLARRRHRLRCRAGFRRGQVSIGICTNEAEASARFILERTSLATYVSALLGQRRRLWPEGGSSATPHLCRKARAPRRGRRLCRDHAVDVTTARTAGTPVIIVAKAMSGRQTPPSGLIARLTASWRFRSSSPVLRGAEAARLSIEVDDAIEIVEEIDI